MNDRSLGSPELRANKFRAEKRVAGAEIGHKSAKSTGVMGEDEAGQPSANDFVFVESDEPTEEELATLRKVADNMPLSAFIVALVELCERFTYYGLSGPFQNYIQYHPEDTPVRGGIGAALWLFTV